MSSYELNRIMWDFHHNPKALELFQHDSNQALKDYELSESERSAIIDGNQIKILEEGGHSLLTLFFVRKMGKLGYYDHALNHDVNTIHLRYG